MGDEICPQDEAFRGWLTGSLSLHDAEALFAHLDGCPRCQAKLATVSDIGSTLVEYLRQPPVHDEFDDEPELRKAVARARAVGDTLPPPDRTSEHGQPSPEIIGELGDYEILEKVAQGGMGTVYKALHTKLGREVALKVLPADRSANETAVARFEQEMMALGPLDHPHIVRALDAREVAGTRFLVMEYIDGVDLSRLVRRRGPLPVAEACELLRQAAVGLQYAHEHELIHRDVKPSNLIVDRQGQLKILDLGLARFRPTESSDDETTRTGRFMGTVEYMAPEQAADTRSVDVRADVYSLGCTLHYLLVGRAPYLGETTYQILRAHHEGPIPSLREERDDVPERLDCLFRKMVAKTPDERHASMNDVIAELEGCLAEMGNLGRRADLSKPRSASLRSKATRRGVTAVLVGVAAMLLLAGLIVELHTPRGELILQVDQQDAEVVIDGGKITITTLGASEPVDVRLQDGKHELTVNKRGFQTHAETFTLESDGHKLLTVTLVPLAGAKAKLEKPKTGKPGSAVREPAAKSAPGVAAGVSLRAGRGEPPPLAVAPFGAEQAGKHQRAWADYLGAPVAWKNSLGMEFVLIPPGEFLMGSSKEEQARAREQAGADGTGKEGWIPAEGPQHPAGISRPFYLAKHEVTQAQWEAAMGNNPSTFKAPTSPVENVSWHDARIYIERLNRETAAGLPSLTSPLETSAITYILPSEAQWEYACRAGSTTAFGHGSDEETLHQSAWFDPSSEGKTHAVGRLQPNAWGLCDMHGNVWEWCADWYAADYYASSPRTDPAGPPAGDARVFRGGSWGHPPCFCRSAFRRGLSPDFRYHSLGFRLAAVLSDE